MILSISLLVGLSKDTEERRVTFWNICRCILLMGNLMIPWPIFTLQSAIISILKRVDVVGKICIPIFSFFRHRNTNIAILVMGLVSYESPGNFIFYRDINKFKSLCIYKKNSGFILHFSFNSVIVIKNRWKPLFFSKS